MESLSSTMSLIESLSKRLKGIGYLKLKIRLIIKLDLFCWAIKSIWGKKLDKWLLKKGSCYLRSMGSSFMKPVLELTLVLKKRLKIWQVSVYRRSCRITMTMIWSIWKSRETVTIVVELKAISKHYLVDL